MIIAIIMILFYLFLYLIVI